MARRRRKPYTGPDAWPGYVDALSTLLMVVIFVLLIFVVGQTLLSAALSRRQHALEGLEGRTTALAQQVQSEHMLNDTLSTTVSALQSQHDADAAALAALRIADQNQISSLDDEVSELNTHLAAAGQAASENDTQISDLTKKLNDALGTKAQGISHYRSEFFDRLQSVLHNQKGVHITGDRFIFQSELLFPPGSADISEAGRKEIITLARTLREVTAHIPASVPWILRVDGHADRQPVHTAFPGNWELSSARAITVVKLLVAQGVNPAHLAATGFSEYQPVDNNDTPEAYARNRRIEFRLTER